MWIADSEGYYYICEFRYIQNIEMRLGYDIHYLLLLLLLPADVRPCKGG